MALVAADTNGVLLERLQRARGQAAHHKAELRRQREALRRSMETLTALEAEVLRRGLSTGEAKESHGHHTPDTRS